LQTARGGPENRGMRVIRASLVVAVLVTSTGGAQAQSLGDLAKAEAARRKAVAASGKVYTNDSLRPEPAPTTPPPATLPAAVPGVPDASTAAASTTETSDDAAGGSPRRDEGYWRKRIETERAALERAQTFMDAIQSRVNALTTDFVNRDDPQQRATIAADRQKALAEAGRLTKEIQQHEKAIKTTQDEARRAGVPAGWVR